MKKIFDINNPVWTFVSRLCDAFLLHLCWIICCLPIVTFGASTTALYYAMMKDVSDEETHYIRAFFRSFKENLVQGSLLGLIYLVAAFILVLVWDFYQTNQTLSEFYQIARIFAIAALIIWVFTFNYVFPLQARFYNPIFQTIKNAFLLAIKNIGWTILMTVVTIAPYAALFLFTFVPVLALGLGLVVLINSYMLNHILQPYIDKKLEEEGRKIDDPDHWEVPDEIPGVWPPVGAAVTEGAAETEETGAESEE